MPTATAEAPPVTLLLRGALAAAAPLIQVPVHPLDLAQVAELVDSLALDGVSGRPSRRPCNPVHRELLSLRP